MSHALTTSPNLGDIFADYALKQEQAEQLVEAFDDVVTRVRNGAGVRGVYGENVFSFYPSLDASAIRNSLLKSAWLCTYNTLGIDRIAPARDKELFKRTLASPPEFTYENVKATFADYVLNPRFHVLKGLAEVFTALDPHYKSHSRVMIGVKGLPKRVIIHCPEYSSYGRERVGDVVRAIWAYRGRNMPDWGDIRSATAKAVWEWEGLTFKRFTNGNIHIHFDGPTLKDINQALAEFYGEVLPDYGSDDNKPDAPRPSTDVARDLQYYPTPKTVAERVANGMGGTSTRVLEPSCGCGRLLDALPTGTPSFGFEVDASRAAEARAKGHRVLIANFLEQPATPDFDEVVMNPPFYGRHYLKHIQHAARFLKPRGLLRSVLPATAWYDHNALPDGGKWEDLPVASFAESGTNVPTGIWTWRDAP